MIGPPHDNQDLTFPDDSVPFWTGSSQPTVTTELDGKDGVWQTANSMEEGLLLYTADDEARETG